MKKSSTSIRSVVKAALRLSRLLSRINHEWYNWEVDRSTEGGPTLFWWAKTKGGPVVSDGFILPRSWSSKDDQRFIQLMFRLV